MSFTLFAYLAASGAHVSLPRSLTRTSAARLPPDAEGDGAGLDRDVALAVRRGCAPTIGGIAASFETLCTPVRAVSDAESDVLLEALR